jgi:hypothetical protein
VVELFFLSFFSPFHNFNIIKKTLQNVKFFLDKLKSLRYNYICKVELDLIELNKLRRKAMFGLFMTIASVIATTQGLRYTEAKIKKVELENEKIKLENLKLKQDIKE